jgi:hypothetical protein
METGKKIQYIEEAIENSKMNVLNILDAVSENYMNFLQSNITHHHYLRDMAEQAGDVSAVMHHQVMAEVYQSMLERHRLPR